MSKKKNKGNKIVKLTDEQYGADIMSIKDEWPPKIIQQTQKND
jgi:hypothetical protein